MKSLKIVALLSLIISCQNQKSERQVASVNALQPKVEQGEVWGQDEVANMNRVGEIFKETLIEATGNNKIMKRDAHPKHHGCVKSELTIDNSKLPQKLRVGLFEENRKYQSIIRFSNGDPDPSKADIEKDIRGMAVKIIGVPYQNYLQDIGLEGNKNIHDLVMMNADSFFIANPKKYEKFMEATQGRFGVIGYLLTHWGSIKRIMKARVEVSNPLDIDYSSATPYKLGSTSMKMSFKSCRKNKDTIPDNPSHDYLGERLAKTLKSEQGCFDFYIQPNKDPKKNNIENAMLSWDEKKSPQIKVGRLIVNRQHRVRDEMRMSACENMTFNPWRAPQVNRPLGGVNRIRLEVYLNQSKLRHDYNGI
ncbi:catalase [Halobacteriovorax sp. YZS-1-1]|uniref:catalase n=1 Tax=unclassified Halobacteriovorax TaxID=2639665 RepID=UPI00399AA9EE